MTRRGIKFGIVAGAAVAMSSAAFALPAHAYTLCVDFNAACVTESSTGGVTTVFAYEGTPPGYPDMTGALLYCDSVTVNVAVWAQGPLVADRSIANPGLPC